jgi:MFS family permease
MNSKYLKGLGINILLLGIVSFLNDVSSEMIMPILPMFIKSLGGAGLAVGLAGGLRDSIPSILNVLAGYWSDKTGKRKIFISAGYLVSSVFKLFLTFSRTWHQAAIFSGLERTGKGLRTAARDAIIAESAGTQRGKGFGIHRAFDSSGAILGSVIAFILSGVFGLDFKLVILIAGIIAFASLVPLRFVKEGGGRSPETSQKTGLPPTKILGGLRELPRPLKLFVASAGVFALGNFSYMFFILKAQGTFTDKLSIAAPILLYILFNIFYAGFAVPFGSLSDRIGRKKVIILGYLLFSLTSFGFACLHSLPAFVILFAIYGIAYAAVDANQRAYASDLAPPQLKATALGVFHTTIGLMALPASLAAGFLWQNVAPSATFICGGVLGFISIFLFVIFRSNFEASKAAISKES